MKSHLDRMTLSFSAMTLWIFSWALWCSRTLQLSSGLGYRRPTCRTPVFTSCLSFSWRFFSQTCFPPLLVSPAQLTEGWSFQLWGGPVAKALWILYGLYMQNGCRSSFFDATLCGLAVQLSHCWPQTFVLERHFEGNLSLIHMNCRASMSVSVSVCVCVCVCVCVQILGLCLAFEKRRVVRCCVYDNF